MDQFIDSGLYPFAFVEGAILFGSPNIVLLDGVDLFGDVHPFVLGGALSLEGVELADETGVGGECGEEGAEDGEELMNGYLVDGDIESRYH